MPSDEYEEILSRIQKLEDGQESLEQFKAEMIHDMAKLFKELEGTNGQMRALEIANNDIKQTVVGYGQTHSMLLTKAMESIVAINSQSGQIVREVQTTKDKIDGNVQVAKLGMKEKVIVGLLATPGLIAGLKSAWSFIINFINR